MSVQIPRTDEIRRALAGPRMNIGPKNHLASFEGGEAVCLCGGEMDLEDVKTERDKRRIRSYLIHRYRCIECGKPGRRIDAA